MKDLCEMIEAILDGYITSVKHSGDTWEISLQVTLV